jgi:predicted DCC family thiol-disulfide oxidoreductase YuxK
MGHLFGLDARQRPARRAARSGRDPQQPAAAGVGAIANPVLYDVDCGFCRWCLAQLLRLDRHGRLRPVALQDPEADLLLSGMPAEQRMSSWHFVSDDGQVYSGGDAFAPLLRLVPGGALPARALDAVPALANVGYRAVAGRRSFFGRLIPARSKVRAQERIDAAARRRA